MQYNLLKVDSSPAAIGKHHNSEVMFIEQFYLVSIVQESQECLLILLAYKIPMHKIVGSLVATLQTTGNNCKRPNLIEAMHRTTK
jgi:hypothetical protein